jgi:DNA-binding PadR family transcriptional regulator
MLKWSVKLLGLFMIFSSFVYHTYASQYEFGDLRRVDSFSFGDFNLGSNFNIEGAILGDTGGDGLGNLFGPDGQPIEFVFPAAKDDPNLPSNTNAPQEHQVEHKGQNVDTARAMEKDDALAPLKPSGLTQIREAEIRRILDRSNKTNPLLFKLLHTLFTKGACEYATLRIKVTSKGKQIYQLCDKYRNQCLIQDVERQGAGIFEITAAGRYALTILKEQYRIGDFPTEKKQARAKDDEVDEDEDYEPEKDEDSALAGSSGAATKEKAKIHKFIGDNYVRKTLLCNLLETLQSFGASSFEFIQKQLESEDQNLSTIWHECLGVPLMLPDINGLYELTPGGDIALDLLSEQGYSRNLYRVTRKRSEIDQADDVDLAGDEDEIEEENAAPTEVALISTAGKSVIRTYLNQSYQKKAEVCKLLEILQTNGECGYSTLRNKGVYSQCNGCVEQGLITRHNNGYYKITPGGQQALRILNKEGFSADPYKPSHKRASKAEEAAYHEEDDDDLAPPKKIPTGKKPAKKKSARKSEAKRPAGDWPEEFEGLRKCDMHLAILKALAHGEGYSTGEITQKAQKTIGSKIDQTTNNLKTHLARGWIKFEVKSRKYFITNEGLRILAKIEPSHQEPIIDEVFFEERIDQDQQEEESRPQSAQNLELMRIPRRTRSLNDLEEEEPKLHIELQRIPDLVKKRKIVVEHPPIEEIGVSVVSAAMHPHVVIAGDQDLVELDDPEVEHQQSAEIATQEQPGITDFVAQEVEPMDVGPDELDIGAEEEASVRTLWEDLTEQLQGHLLKQLDENILPGVLANELLMKSLLKGDFIQNLCIVSTTQFYYLFGIKIEHAARSNCKCII